MITALSLLYGTTKEAETCDDMLLHIIALYESSGRSSVLVNEVVILSMCVDLRHEAHNRNTIELFCVSLENNKTVSAHIVNAC